MNISLTSVRKDTVLITVKQRLKNGQWLIGPSFPVGSVRCVAAEYGIRDYVHSKLHTRVLRFSFSQLCPIQFQILFHVFYV